MKVGCKLRSSLIAPGDDFFFLLIELCRRFPGKLLDVKLSLSTYPEREDPWLQIVKLKQPGSAEKPRALQFLQNVVVNFLA
jgi:hypothetical protein